MDVLDHSCSKLGFGGKMCIDGTKKFEEEMDDRYAAQEKCIFRTMTGWIHFLKLNP